LLIILKKEHIGGFIKKFLVFLLALLIGGYFGVGYYVFGIAASVPCEVWIEEAENKPDNWSLGEKADWDPSDYFIENYKEVSIFADDGEIELKSWWVENNLSNPTIILLHGLTSSKNSPDILLPMGMMNKSEFNLLAIDMRDHGESTCEDGFYAAGQNETDDVVAAIDWLIDKGISPSNIGIYGNSLGALVGLMTPAKTNEFGSIAVIDPPVDFETLVREEMSYQGFPTFLWEPIYHYALVFKRINMLKDIPEEALSKGNKQPLLIFSGLQSDRVLPHHSDDLVDIAKANNIDYNIYKYDGMGHTQILYFYTEEYSQLLTDFYKSTLSG
jgi:pimeloyl-ACP methyl ester carboxylesterase